MTRTEAHGSAVCESSKGAWQQQRNAAGLEQAPEIAHLLEVLEEHLMVGRKYTATGKERSLCASCGRKFAVRADGMVRRHDCK